MRARSVFTATTISPSPSLRQRSARYTIRARRNLPDKEFRYLRTVRAVTTLSGDGIDDPFCISLCRSDYIFRGDWLRGLAYSLWGCLATYQNICVAVSAVSSVIPLPADI